MQQKRTKRSGSASEWIVVGLASLLLLGIVAAIVGLLLSRGQTEVALQPTAVPTTAPTAAPTPTAVPPATPSAEPSAEAPAAPTAVPEPTPVLATYEPRFEEARCPMELPADMPVDCGYLVVPEDRSQPDGTQVRLAVAIIRSSAAQPAPDPLFYLEGGPGGTAMYTLDLWLSSRFVEQRDVVVFDQRGTGHSTPSLNCPEVSEWSYSRFLSSPDGFLRKQILRCHSRLLDEGVNLAMYNSAANAADLNDLRRTLGYEQINLLGISYGTRLALTTMRDQPQHIRSVVLDSTYPPDVNLFAEQSTNTVRAFDALFDGCAADAECNAAYPNLRNEFYHLVERLNEQPVNVPMSEYGISGGGMLTFSGHDLTGLIFLAMYDTNLIPLLPQLIFELANNDSQMLASLVALTFSGLHHAPAWANTADGFSEGMYYSVQCHEEMPFSDDAEVAAAIENASVLQDYFIHGFEMDRTMCRIWKVHEASNNENKPVQSDIPTLVLAGQYDPITPPAWGQQAAESLSNSFFYEFPGFGHGVSIDDACPESITQAFLNNPVAAPDTTCLAEMSGPDFALPMDVATVDGAAVSGPLTMVEHGGNIRNAPDLADTAVIGQVCPGDMVSVLDQQQVGAVLWYYVRVEVGEGACDVGSEPVPEGTEGWISSVLLNW
jgi:pimeloyl-ACP methyl ester carboxylesterase